MLGDLDLATSRLNILHVLFGVLLGFGTGGVDLGLRTEKRSVDVEGVTTTGGTILN